MANISLYLIAIKEAIFGKDMREAVYKSIEAINRDTEDIAESRASTTEFGMVKLHASTTQGVLTNKSGLRIHPETEGLMVVTKPENGVRLNGTGEIEINPADVNDAMAGIEDYKPITPLTLKAVLDAGGAIPDGSVSWAKCDTDLQSRINTGGSSGVARDYDTTGGTIKVKFDEIDNGKAPKSHASTGTTYGKGTGSNYGHVKLSDAIDSTSGVNGGIAATPNAIKTLQESIINRSLPFLDYDGNMPWGLSYAFIGQGSYESEMNSNGLPLNMVWIYNDTANTFGTGTGMEHYPPASVEGDDYYYEIMGTTDRLLPNHSYIVFTQSRPITGADPRPGELIVLADVTDNAAKFDSIELAVGDLEMIQKRDNSTAVCTNDGNNRTISSPVEWGSILPLQDGQRLTVRFTHSILAVAPDSSISFTIDDDSTSYPFSPNGIDPCTTYNYPAWTPIIAAGTLTTIEFHKNAEYPNGCWQLTDQGFCETARCAERVGIYYDETRLSNMEARIAALEQHALLDSTYTSNN